MPIGSTLVLFGVMFIAACGTTKSTDLSQSLDTPSDNANQSEAELRQIAESQLRQTWAELRPELQQKWLAEVNKVRAEIDAMDYEREFLPELIRTTREIGTRNPDVTQQGLSQADAKLAIRYAMIRRRYDGECTAGVTQCNADLYAKAFPRASGVTVSQEQFLRRFDLFYVWFPMFAVGMPALFSLGGYISDRWGKQQLGMDVHFGGIIMLFASVALAAYDFSTRPLHPGATD